MYLITSVLWCPAVIASQMRYLDLFLEAPPFQMPTSCSYFLRFNLWYMWGHLAIARDSDTGVEGSHCLSVSDKNPSKLHTNKNPRAFFQCGVTWKGISPWCCFGNTVVIFVLSAVPSTPPSWGLKHALILPTTARRVCYGQQQEACRNLWGVCVSAEKEPRSQFAVSFHYSRRNFLMESGSCSRQTLHKREMPGLALRLVWCIGNKKERNWELKVKKRAEIQGSPQELQVLVWQNGQLLWMRTFPIISSSFSSPFFPSFSPLSLFSLLCSLAQVWEGLNKLNKWTLTFPPLQEAAVFPQLNRCIAMDAQHLSAWLHPDIQNVAAHLPWHWSLWRGRALSGGDLPEGIILGWLLSCPASFLKHCMSLSFFPCNIISCRVNHMENWASGWRRKVLYGESQCMGSAFSTISLGDDSQGRKP